MPSTKLSPRLQAIADLVPICDRVFDIGTDHAFLPIRLILTERCREAVAIDIRPGPLDAAVRNIDAAGLSGRILVLQNDGLSGLSVGPEDVVILSGLGGNEIRDILGRDYCRCGAIIIQAQKSLPELRDWLAARGYPLEKEKLVHDQGRFYVIMQYSPPADPAVAVGYTAAGAYRLSRLEAWVGPLILKDRPPGWHDYVQDLLPRLRKKCRSDATLQDLVCQIEMLDG